MAAGLPAGRKRSQGARKAAAKKRREGSREEGEVAQVWQPHQADSSSGYQSDAGWGGRLEPRVCHRQRTSRPAHAVPRNVGCRSGASRPTFLPAARRERWDAMGR